METAARFDDAQKTIIVLGNLVDYLASANCDWRKDSAPGAEYAVHLIVQFVGRIIQDLKAAGNASAKRDPANDSRGPRAGHKWNALLNEARRSYERIERDLRTKAGRIGRTERYFDVVDRQLRFAVDKKIMKTEAIIVAAMKEHEHKMTNLETELENVSSKIETTTRNNMAEKNNRTTIRNKLEIRKASVVRAYDSEMIKKHKNVIVFNSKIKTIEENIRELRESIAGQRPLYDAVIAEKEVENERIWHEKLYAIQRQIAARKIQMHFRRYLNYIKTRDAKKAKKGQHKKAQSKAKNV